MLVGYDKEKHRVHNGQVSSMRSLRCWAIRVCYIWFAGPSKVYHGIYDVEFVDLSFASITVKLVLWYLEAG